ncbi:hypothetical protein SAMN04488054_1515 [Salibacterium qingdaonense]|uniref:Uncharacterized protein n=1 Tax=Salibacterium qingdaonense TaxID=266892 RepID=A0A1I4QVE8_9BACI|nr:hypothetical protein SAMN04488054_1515 [Salibacterium qingdaonense]
MFYFMVKRNARKGKMGNSNYNVRAIMKLPCAEALVSSPIPLDNPSTVSLSLFMLLSTPKSNRLENDLLTSGIPSVISAPIILLPHGLFIPCFFVFPQRPAYLFIPVGCRTLVGRLLVPLPHCLCVAPSGVRNKFPQLGSWLPYPRRRLPLNSSGCHLQIAPQGGNYSLSFSRCSNHCCFLFLYIRSSSSRCSCSSSEISPP